MKKLFIAATIVGAAAAGLILYLRNRTSAQVNACNVVDAASHAYKNVLDNTETASRPPQHAMG